MAISKILYMKDCGNAYHGMHLKRSLDYIMDLEKTQGGRLIGGMNCQPDRAYEQMRDTKTKFGKNNQRQGYHIVLSFKEGEVDPDTVFELTQKFVKEYLGAAYEAVFTVHDNTQHVHSHIVFNSVSFLDGKKYHYKKGDWAKEIQPITNRLCAEYGLSVLEIAEERAKEDMGEREWSVSRVGAFVWSDMIKRDLDACILQSASYESFLELLAEKGYEIKQAKYLAVRPPGMNRYKRCKTLGAEYTEERIRERIQSEDLSQYAASREAEIKPAIIRCHVKRYHRAKMSGLQKRYYSRLYRIGKLKKRPYSQAWKYRDEIRKMQKLQQQYLFLARHEIHSLPELAVTIQNLTNKRKESSSEKSRVYRARAKFQELFAMAEDMKELEPAEHAYQSGDTFFTEEHEQWATLEHQLQAQGYTYEEVVSLREFYKNEIRRTAQKASAVIKELNLAKSVLRDSVKADGAEPAAEKKEEIEEKSQEKIQQKTEQKTRESSKQPKKR